ncbi:putative DNA modification/repair radical SAM protein [Chitinophagales bacterium]|nr:putative DNA modification/repair radical SAM protein [Chitinophagales bacterium]
MNSKVQEKLAILADAAKYDVSCASSGSKRKNKAGGLGNATGMGICHTYTEDGRCVSLLKILLTNYCIFDCAYCINRKSNDVKRAMFSVKEVVDLTIGFYRRNYIEGLFLSSGIFKDADFTMERLVRIARDLRLQHNFNGYIHLKLIPGASDELVHEAGLYADRLSVNIEIPSEKSLMAIAPEKNYKEVYEPMNYLKEAIQGYQKEKKIVKSTPLFAPGGQSTQLVIGATPENDFQVLQLANSLYQSQNLKRVYYSGYIPVSQDNRLPAISTPPLIRENRIYQADWLMRFYKFSVDEIITKEQEHLDLDIDPKLAYALRNLHLFPVDINSAPYEMILRVPGIGVRSARMIVQARRFKKLSDVHLRKMKMAWNRAKYFITYQGQKKFNLNPQAELIKNQILFSSSQKSASQLSLFR